MTEELFEKPVNANGECEGQVNNGGAVLTLRGRSIRRAPQSQAGCLADDSCLSGPSQGSAIGKSLDNLLGPSAIPAETRNETGSLFSSGAIYGDGFGEWRSGLSFLRPPTASDFIPFLNPLSTALFDTTSA